MRELEQNRRWRLVAHAIPVVAAALLGLAYSLYTSHVWEDFLIVFRFAHNICDGAGLVYEPGRRVYGFSSPLGALLPALLHLASGCGSHEATLWLYRLIVGIPAMAAGAVLLAATSRQAGLGCSAAAMGTALYLLDAKTVIFSVSGMETGLMLAVTGLALLSRATTGGQARRWLLTGLAWAGLLWTRADGMVFIAALCAGEIAFPSSPRHLTLLAMIRALGLAFLIFAPWVGWSWWYYGTPLPQSLVAKGLLLQQVGTTGHLVAGASYLLGVISGVYGPVYAHLGGWPLPVQVASGLLGAVAGSYWLFPLGEQDRLACSCSLTFALLILYLAALPFAYPWYFPPVAMIGIPPLAAAACRLGRAVLPASRSGAMGGILLAVPVAFSAAILLLSAAQMKWQQRWIEDAVRRQAGLWLREHVPPGERIYLECPGYIGYFSGGRILDYPGLVSPEVTQASSGLSRPGFAAVAMRLMPEWMVLRPQEQQWLGRYPGFRECYALRTTFRSPLPVSGSSVPLGEGYLRYDSIFAVYHRIACSPGPGHPGTTGQAPPGCPGLSPRCAASSTKENERPK